MTCGSRILSACAVLTPNGNFLRCPTEYCLPNLTPLWANRNLGANRSDVVSGGILTRDVNVAVCFHFCVNDAASQSIPLSSDGIRPSE